MCFVFYSYDLCGELNGCSSEEWQGELDRALRAEDVDAKLRSVGRWPGLAEDLAKEARIRDMLCYTSRQ